MKFHMLHSQKPGFSRLFIIALTSLLFACSASVKSDLDESARPVSNLKTPAPAISETKIFYPASNVSIAPPPKMMDAAPSYSNQSPRAHYAPMLVSPPSENLAYQAATSTAKYQEYQENAWKRVSTDPVSTFSADVDTGSYANVRRFLNSGQFPQHDAVRAEEMINYFSYDYSAPKAKDEHPFSVHTEVVASPWNKVRALLRVAIKGKDIAKESLPAANLVFLVDVSGSMEPQERLPLVKSALKLLTAQLREQDRVSLVTYANGTQVVLKPTPGNQKDTILHAIDRLVASGGTDGEAGIKLAYLQAHAGKIKGGINRVLLATDGDLNLGMTNPRDLQAMVERERKTGIGLSTLGVGDDNYNDALMKKLADAGDGSYHYLDTLQEAHKVLVNEFTSNLSVIANDLKLQLEFNPNTVDEYRLIGYELRGLTREQFNDDKVDAGDIGAGHTVTALYEIVPHGAPGNTDPLRYTASKEAAISPQNDDKKMQELAWVKLRYKVPGNSISTLVEIPIAKPDALPTIQSADTDMRFAVAVASWAQWLRGSALVGNFTSKDILKLANASRGEDRFGHRAEFIKLVTLSANLKPTKTQNKIVASD